ncbi:hypothetical protein EON67_09365, partial [archaeon]
MYTTPLPHRLPCSILEAVEKSNPPALTKYVMVSGIASADGRRIVTVVRAADAPALTAKLSTVISQQLYALAASNSLMAGKASLECEQTPGPLRPLPFSASTPLVNEVSLQLRALTVEASHEGEAFRTHATAELHVKDLTLGAVRKLGAGRVSAAAPPAAVSSKAAFPAGGAAAD